MPEVDKMDTDEIQEKEDKENIELLSLKVLIVVRERQQQHGLRHGDYQRYHGYCARRLRRLRESLKMPQGDRRHFKKKDVTKNDLESPKGDSRHLEILLILAERAWAYAMMLKQDANTEPRKKYHLVARMRKAIGHAEHLLNLSKECERVDARTKLESEAYLDFIRASLYFEEKDWNKAMEFYKKAQAIYTQIARALGAEHPEAVNYEAKNSELLPTMRFCAYQTGAELKISELASEFQSTAIEAMIAQRPKMSEVTFRNNKIIIPNEKIIALLVRIDDIENKADKKIEIYEDILVDLRDAIQMVRDSIKPEQAAAMGKGTGKPPLLLTYLLYLRLKLTNSRTELMLQEKTVARDCIRLVDLMLQNLEEMKTIQGLEEDEEFKIEMDNFASFWKGIRCRYLGDVYVSIKKWSEAIILFNKAEEHFKIAIKDLPADSPYQIVIKETDQYVKKSSLECRALSILEEQNDETNSLFKLKRPKELLRDRMDQYVMDESLVSGEPNVTTFPPDFRPISCKPLFFDLALNHIKMPLDEIGEEAGISKKKSSPSKEAGTGLTGFVKGLWGWGSGK